MPADKTPNLAEKLEYLFGDASAARMANTALSLASGRAGWTTPPAKPWMLQVEVTNRCNINCLFCSRAVEDMRLGDLSPELEERIVDLSASVQETALFGYGEPLMSKAFYSLLPKLRSSRVGFFTNGVLLDERLFHKLLDMSVRPFSYIVFSFDGASPEVYESIRSGASFDKVWGNIRAVVAARERLGLKRPQLRLEFVAMRRNAHELPALIRMADDAGVDGIKVSHLVVWDDSFREESLLLHPELCRESFRQAREEAGRRRLWLDLPKTFEKDADQDAPPPPCHSPWHYAMISYSGDVRACCFAPALRMGDLTRDSFDDIWNGEGYRRLRRSVNSPSAPACCLRCEERYRRVPSPDERATYLKLAPRKS